MALQLRLSEERAIQGLPVIVTTDGEDADVGFAFARVEQALDLIAKYDPIRLSRMRRDLKFIWVRRHPMCRASHNPTLGACQIDLYNFVVSPEFTAAQIAASIVHEATHARLASAGIYYSDEAGTRIERICKKAELKFGLRLPRDGEAVVERAMRLLVAHDEGLARAFTRAELAEIERRKKEVLLEHMDLPRWAKSLIRWRRGYREPGAA